MVCGYVCMWDIRTIIMYVGYKMHNSSPGDENVPCNTCAEGIASPGHQKGMIRQRNQRYLLPQTDMCEGSPESITVS